VLGRRWFEIQIRSILEHAWAEIEHEVVYKAGVDYPTAVRRRFAALAGSLELLDAEFLSLRAVRNDLIDNYRNIYDSGREPRKPFDVARLLGFLEAIRPEGRSWRQAAADGLPFAAGLDTTCVEALQTVGLGTAASLRTFLHSRAFRRALRGFAANQGTDPAHTSHLAIVVVAVAIKEARTIRSHFPEIMYDPAITALVARRALL
jgi:hypothetical protein